MRLEVPDLHRVRMIVGEVVAVNADGTVDVDVPGEGVLEQVSTIGSSTVGSNTAVFTADLQAWAVGGGGAGQMGAQGPPGPKGDPGPQGIQGPPGPTQGPIVYGTLKGRWDTYTDIAAVEPNWTRHAGGGVVFEARNEPGLWYIEAHCYLDVTGGTSSAQGTLFGVAAGLRTNNASILAGIQSGTIPDQWANGNAVTLGRLTVSSGARNVIDAYSSGWIQNVPGRRLDVRPIAQFLSSQVAGASAKFGLCRVTVTFQPQGTLGAPLNYN